TLFIAPFLSSFCGKYLTIINPGFYADFAVSCVCFCKTVIDICTKCLKRNSSFAVELCTGHICAAETSGYCGFDTFCSGFHCSLHGRFHSTSEGDTVLK